MPASGETPRRSARSLKSDVDSCRWHSLQESAKPLLTHSTGRQFDRALEQVRDRTGLVGDPKLDGEVGVPRFLPLHEHSGAVLHRLSWRHWCAAALGPMDFAGWFEAFLGAHWYTFDPRNNMSRIGPVLIAQGATLPTPITHSSVPIRWSVSRCGRTSSASLVSSSPAGRYSRQASTRCKAAV